MVNVYPHTQLWYGQFIRSYLANPQRKKEEARLLREASNLKLHAKHNKYHFTLALLFIVLAYYCTKGMCIQAIHQNFHPPKFLSMQ